MLSGLIARTRSLWRGVRRRRDVDAEMKEEFRLHVEMRADDLVRHGMSPADAARQARLEFGSPDHYRDKGRESRGLRRFDDLRVSWLDVKLGFRMLVKYPGLTIVGGIAIAFAVAVGAGGFEVIKQIVAPTMPLDEGDRIVAIRLWNAAKRQREPTTLHDVARWRTALESVEDVGAYRTSQRNLITENGGGEPVEVAEISASAFRLTRVPPLLGRSLVDADEQIGGPSVVVIGYDIWQTHFAGDPGVVGRTLRLGSTPSTIVGVMPKGYAFPLSHGVWVPLRLNPLAYKPNEGPELARIFGRLAPGAGLDQAQSELLSMGRRREAAVSNARAPLRPQILPYAKSVIDIPTLASAGLMSINLFLAMLLVLVFGNVALLVFARAATREAEIVVRNALGASRTRIIMQLFAEALVLGGVSAAVGLVVARAGLAWGIRVLADDAGAGRLPFWVRDHMAPSTIVYAIALTLLGAVIAGVMPALKVTRGIESRLRQAAAGTGGVKFGGVWTAVIVAQVAVTVAFPVGAFFSHRDQAQIESLDVGFAAREYLTFRLQVDRDNGGIPFADTSRAAFVARFGERYRDVERRLEGDPGVTGVTFATMLPGMDHRQRWVEIEGVGRVSTADAIRGDHVSNATVATDYFDVIGAPILAGRGFHDGDLESGHPVAIVNQSFVRQTLGGRNPVGQRVRYLDLADEDIEISGPKPGPWIEIVGVVRDLGMTDGSDPHESGAGFYQPATAGASPPLNVVAHVRGDPMSFVKRLRATALAVDPSLRIDQVMPLDRVQDVNLRTISFFLRLIVTLSVIALLVALTGIYAVMAFTVARRTREIGVRIALGADARRVAATIFARPLAQVSAGVLTGTVLVAVLVRLVLETLTLRETATIVGYAALMMGVCLLACVVPTRRALRVEPTEALRADG